MATPRVTALNNRPAQIESGSQIPVQTTQAASGTAVVTTTFVSVPLRLSITPQITDVGTVVLRVTIENNTLNTGIAVGGVPGIDTQRMQSEVLVPDVFTVAVACWRIQKVNLNSARLAHVSSGCWKSLQAQIDDSSEHRILFFITPHLIILTIKFDQQQSISNGPRTTRFTAVPR